MKRVAGFGIAVSLLLSLVLALDGRFKAAAAGVIGPNTLLVTNTQDSGPGSVRDAIISANPGDTITFDTAGIFATRQTILLKSELLVDKDLTIQGPAFNGPRISGQQAVRVFNITSAATTVTLSGMTILL